VFLPPTCLPACLPAVIWSQSKDTFPFLNGVSVIVISWFTSPLLSGLAGAALFLFTRHAGEPEAGWLKTHQGSGGGAWARHACAQPVPAGGLKRRGHLHWHLTGHPLCPVHSPTPPTCSPCLRAVLRRQNSYKLSLWMLPLFTFITVYIGWVE